ncbi:MAG: GlmU family protein [Bacteroidales bacterium]|jgi:UDP-N-acetylglucosamine diphosphorylase/glucosamine-1-phosphate N-acetyltransferase|nr:GlmU family protein [Bacteroidales bacterium]NLM93183.1 glucose-1-phosphate thymidylyltransferase [Bacteroidales bacterium]
MNYILFGDQTREHLLPFTFLRPLADIRVGILTIREKWELYLGAKTSTLTEEYLSVKYPIVKKADNVLINSSVLPGKDLVKEIGQLEPNQTLVLGDVLIAHRLRDIDIDNLDADALEKVIPLESKAELKKLNNLWDIVVLNEQAIVDDFLLITKGRKSQPLGEHVRVIAPENIFVEEGAVLEMAMINASEGPVYIGKNAQVMDGAVLRGPVGVGEGAKIRMAAKIYPGSSIGPYCKVGGEMSQSVIFGYTNKAHDGYLGHSVIGEWCNLGADTNASNLKNNYDEVRLWDYAENSFVNTGQQFCGTFMGDHSKCGINTMFNTGTVIGINAQIFGAGFMRNFIPSFSWGSVAGFSNVDINKAVQVAQRVFARKGLEFGDLDEQIIRNVYNQSFSYRRM